jgi:hypothetical protein
MTVLHVPGDWPCTNHALSLLRSEGSYMGRRAGTALAGVKPRANALGYAALAKQCRERVFWEAKRQRVKHLGLVGVSVYLLPVSVKPDPDAWSIVGKWAVDGLADANAIGNDRWSVAWTHGRCLRSAEEARALWARHGWAWTGWRPGLVIELHDLQGEDIRPWEHLRLPAPQS